jgi:FlaG/FlaF family flagellin (archaellin)
MALIPKFIVVANEFPVQAGQSIIEGMFVKQYTDGTIVLATGASDEVALGIAGDTKSTSVSGLADTNASSVGAFVNRISDQFDETKASGKMTVYHSGGFFTSNQYETGSYTVSCPLYISVNGNLTVTPSASVQVVGYCTAVPAAYPSGVPGIDVNGSISLGNFLEFKLRI